jgi:ATP-dependent protease Clp ATPase subunit
MPWGRVRCSFCGKNHESVGRLVSGRHGDICETCVGVAPRIIEASDNSAPSTGVPERPSPLRRLLTTLRRVFNLAHTRSITIERAA